jgi:hypothetical protein
VVEVPHLVWIEQHGFPVVYSYRQLAIRIDLLYGSEVPIGNAEIAIGRCELESVSNSKVSFRLTIGADSGAGERDCR